MGKTIIAVTHDEHYFQVADRLHGKWMRDTLNNNDVIRLYS